jgi:hypothetical protein
VVIKLFYAALPSASRQSTGNERFGGKTKNDAALFYKLLQFRHTAVCVGDVNGWIGITFVNKSDMVLLYISLYEDIRVMVQGNENELQKIKITKFQGKYPSHTKICIEEKLTEQVSRFSYLGYDV